MEMVKNLNDINNLKNNKIIGSPKLINSVIKFKGRNNILFCEEDVELNNAQISFEDNNSLIYLSSCMHNYPLNLFIHNDSVVFIGKNNYIGAPFILNIQEYQNLIIGDGCILARGINLKTSDVHAIFNKNTKERINFSQSIYIGDHVWIGQSSFISRGVKIGSGSIIGNCAFVPPNTIFPSNCYAYGNPTKIVNKDVFFTTDFLGHNTPKDTIDRSTYKSDIFIFEVNPSETLDISKIDKILNELKIEQKLEFIQKLFVKNKRKNRFAIK